MVGVRRGTVCFKKLKRQQRADPGARMSKFKPCLDQGLTGGLEKLI